MHKRIGKKEIHEIDPMVPSIVATAHSDTDFLKKAIDLGVRGYCMKPINLKQLLKSITIAAESGVLKKKLEYTNKFLEQQVKERTQELQVTIEKLEVESKKLLYEATHDHLTKLYNRQKLNVSLSTEIHREHRYQRNLSIIMFDIDHFKDINDTYGHDIGDEVLINLAKLTQNSIRSIDILSRWGGEEFILLLPETSLDNAINIAEKLRIDIENTNLTNNESIKITASFGVTMLQKEDDKTSFLRRVDDALYEAKDLGRNRVVSK